jgi:enoyl-CoA hydratase/carnithine racemase
MMADLVEYSLEGHVVTITLNRPDKLNAFDAALVRALAGALRRYDEDDGARVAVLTGAGKAFSSGADVAARQCRTIDEFERLGGPQEPDAHSGDLLTRAVKWKPVIAAPHGYVMGLAVGIVLECDIVVAEAETKFQITETSRGLGGARYWGLAHFCGASAFATEVALTGRFFSAEEAREAGLIARVSPKAEHLNTALQIAQSIARHPPLSVRSTVRSRRYFMDVFEREIAAQTDPMKLYLTEDFREAVRAHLEKRQPGAFHGR